MPNIKDSELNGIEGLTFYDQEDFEENVTKKCNCKDIRARNRINQFLCQEKEDGYFSMEKDINVESFHLRTNEVGCRCIVDK